MSNQAKTLHPIGRAVLAITALGVIVVSANLLISSLGVGHKNVDFTENKIHTLSDGTRGILKELGAPVTIRYYATRSSAYMPEDLKLHMPAGWNRSSTSIDDGSIFSGVIERSFTS